MYFSQAQLGLQVAIESERILKVLDQTVEHLELAARLPSLIENDMALLRPYLSDAELEIVAECDKYSPFTSRKPKKEKGEGETRARQRHTEDRGTKPSWPAMGFGDSAYNHASMNPGKEDPDVSKAIHLLCSKPKRLIKIVRHAQMSESCSKLVELMRLLRCNVEMRLRVSPAMERMRDIEMRAAYHRNELAKGVIGDLEAKLATQKKEADALLAAKARTIEKHRARIGSLVSNFRQNCKKIVNESERQMVVDTKNSEFRKNLLAQEVKATQTQLSSLLNEHLQSEKSLRAKRYKVETQLLSWLEKYDQDMGEKQVEWEDIEGGYNKEKEEMEILQDEFDAQEDIYEKLMEEKDAEYQRELEEKMYIFLIHRSARRIQRCWRLHIARKMARKKARRRSSRKAGSISGAKKGKGKKKK